MDLFTVADKFKAALRLHTASTLSNLSVYEPLLTKITVIQ